MDIDTYKFGEWIFASYELPDWPSHIEQYDDYLKFCGFSPHSITWGDESDEEIKFYANTDKDGNLLETSWLADIPTTNSSYYFYIPNHPSFLLFKKEFKHLYVKQPYDFVDVEGVLINKKYIKSITKHFYKHRQCAVIDCESDDDNYCRFTKEITATKDGKFYSNINDWIDRNFC